MTRVVVKNMNLIKSWMTRRVAIWGWSYGGFATALTLEQGVRNQPLSLKIIPYRGNEPALNFVDNSDNPVFSCGISGGL